MFDDDKKALGPELISRDEFVLGPAERRTIDVTVAGETRYVGAVAAFLLVIFLQMFLNGGVYDGKRILGRATVEAMLADQNKQLGHPWGLGWGLRASSVWNAFGDLSSDRTFGHSGASGTVAWADPQRELLCVILTTRPWRQDEGRLLRRIANVVQAAME